PAGGRAGSSVREALVRRSREIAGDAAPAGRPPAPRHHWSACGSGGSSGAVGGREGTPRLGPPPPLPRPAAARRVSATGSGPAVPAGRRSHGPPRPAHWRDSRSGAATSLGVGTDTRWPPRPARAGTG